MEAMTVMSEVCGLSFLLLQLWFAVISEWIKLLVDLKWIHLWVKRSVFQSNCQNIRKHERLPPNQRQDLNQRPHVMTL